MLVIGVTGSSGSGKSSVCEIISQIANAKIIDADKVVKKLQDNKTEYYEKIVETFGKEILQETGLIDRKKLASIIFVDKSQKEKLDKLTTEYVVKEIKKEIENLKFENLDYIIVDAPTLIESGMANEFDKIIVVTANKESKIKRICERDNITEDVANQRLDSQKEDEFYEAYASFVIQNNDSNIKSKVENIFKQLEREF